MPVGPRPAPPIGIARVAVSGRYNTSPWANVFHVRLAPLEAIDIAVVEAVAAQFLVTYGDDFSSIAHNSWQAETCNIVCRTGPVVAVHASVNDVSAGVLAGDNLPSQVSACISWNVSLYYRGGHPRTYLTGHTYDQIGTEREWSSDFRDQAQTAAFNLLTAVNGLSPFDVTVVELGMLSYVFDGDWRDTPLFVPFNDATVDLRIDTQRRRLGRDR